MIVGKHLIKQSKFVAKIAISFQIRKLWPRIGFWQASNSKPKLNQNCIFTAVIKSNQTRNLKSETDPTLFVRRTHVYTQEHEQRFTLLSGIQSQQRAENGRSWPVAGSTIG